MPLKHWQAWGINHFSRKPVPGFDHPLGKETLPNVDFEPSLTDVALSLDSSGFHSALPLLRKLQKGMRSSLSFLQTSVLSCSSQDFLLKDLHILQLWGLELHTVIKVRPHQRWIHWDSHLSWLTSSAMCDAPQNVGLPAEATHCWFTEPAVHQHLQIPFHKGTLHPVLMQFNCWPH